MIWSQSPDHTRAFGHPVPHSGSLTRRQVALPRSQATPVKTGPALSPRWCPDGSPSRLQDCCLPAGGHRRLSPPDDLEGYPCVHHDMLCGTPSRGLSSRVPSSFVRPWLGGHVECASGLLARLWPGRTCTVGAHPLGHNDPFPRLAPSPKVSGFPWRDHHVIRGNVSN